MSGLPPGLLTEARATTWFWTFSHFHEPEFTRDALTSALYKWAQTLPGKRVAEGSLRRDVEVFLRTYVPSRHGRRGVFEDSLDCPLVELGLIVLAGDGATYQFRLEVRYMSQQWIIKVLDGGRPVFICEHNGELHLTWERSEAAVYPTELQAKCALVYVADRHQPRLVRQDGSFSW